jgi:hypothetical protein
MCFRGDSNVLANRVQRELKTLPSEQGARPATVSAEVFNKIKHFKDKMGKHHAVARESR